MSDAPSLTDFAGAVEQIRNVQRADGGVPWFEGGVLDAWNHAEAIMGLNLAGAQNAARHGFDYLRDTQLADGSWRGQLGGAVPIDETLQNFSRDSMMTGQYIRDTNSSAYVATALWHDYCLHGDVAFVRRMWSYIRRGLNFVLAHQTPYGDICWAAREAGLAHDDALLTSCCSIYKSLSCAIKLAQIIDAPYDDLQTARARLHVAITQKPERFDRHWESKQRFSMDWYYPVLSGVFTGAEAQAHLMARWDEFVIDGYGCLCVSDEPWVTIAESAELILALLVANMKGRAHTHFEWLQQHRTRDGAYWMGYQLEEKLFWPAEKPPWTAAAVLLAADAIYRFTPAAGLFSGEATAATT